MKKFMTICLMILFTSGSAVATFTGNTSATFGVPTPSSGVVYSGVGTNEFRHGQAGWGSTQNILIMDGLDFSITADTPFAVAHLTYTNGQTGSGTAIDTVPVDIDFTFTDPAGLVKTFTFTFDFDLTPNNTGDPVLDADKLIPVNVFSTTNFSVGSDFYTLQLLGFSNDGGSSIVSSFTLPEDATTESDLYAQITTLLLESLFTQTTSFETLRSQEAVLENATVIGDFNGVLDFTNFEIITIDTGAFAGKGFSKGQCEVTLDGATYTGDWKGVLFLKPQERKIYLKGATTGEVSATVEGYLTESVLDSNIYDNYQATWKIGRLGTTTTSATINLNGTLTYQDSSEFPATELYLLQSSIDGTISDHYVSSLSSVINHVRIAEGTNPYYGEGFSIISYVTESGQGEGYTYDKLISSGLVEMKGLFTSPLFGIVSGKLDETTSPRTLFLTIERVDLGLPPAPDLKVRTWGPGRVSPGQTVNYIIEYRNDGLKAANEAIVFNILDSPIKFLSASYGANYDEFFHSVSWNLGKVPPKTIGLLSVRTEIEWGLSQGTALGISAYIVDVEGAAGSPNLFVNGINLKFGSDGAKKYDEFARNQEAGWVPVYYTGNEILDALHVDMATPRYFGSPKEDLTPTNYNGLTQPLITEHSYDTVYAYSGGTRTVLTAIRYYNLRCKKLVLISPISGQQEMFGDTYRKEIEDVLQNKGVEEIEIYQSAKDILPIGNLYQAKFDPDDPWLQGKNIKVHPVNLPGQAGIPAHIELFMYVNDKLKGKEGTSSSAPITITTALDPSVKYGPEGQVLPGEKLNYRVEYENEGEGIAFGVYFTDTLDDDLNDATLEIGPIIDVNTGLEIAPPGNYNPVTRTITWFAGEVGPGQGGYSDFNVAVLDNANGGTEIINYATIYFPSVPEETRTNGIVSIVPPPSPILVTKCSVTAGSKDNSDKISISGNMDATADDFNGVSIIEVAIDSNDMVNPCVLNFPINDKTFKKGKYSYAKTESGSKKSFTYSTKTGKFTFAASNIDLSGLGCPLTVEIEIGDYAGAAEVNEAIVNGTKKPIPIKLMMGVKNALRVEKPYDKFQVTRGKKKPNTDQLSVRGGFAVEDPNVSMTNRVSEGLVITLGTQQFTIPATELKAGKDKFTCSKANVTEGGIASATFNFTTCSFTMTIKNTEIEADAGAVDFGLEFADFGESVPVVLP